MVLHIPLSIKLIMNDTLSKHLTKMTIINTTFTFLLIIKTIVAQPTFVYPFQLTTTINNSLNAIVNWEVEESATRVQFELILGADDITISQLKWFAIGFAPHHDRIDNADLCVAHDGIVEVIVHSLCI
jgi:hypothetical protein